MAAPKPNERIINVGSRLTNLTLLASFVFKLLGCLFIFCSSFTDLLYTEMVITIIQNHVKLYICRGGRTFKCIHMALGCNKHVFCNYLGDFWNSSCPHFSLKTLGFRCEAMTQATTRPSLICHAHVLSSFFQKTTRYIGLCLSIILDYLWLIQHG